MTAVHNHTREPAEETSESDAAVVRRVRAGDTEAFAVLVARYYGRCLQYARRALGDRDDADDAVQAAFVRAFAALGRYEERSRFVAWLLAIVNNECRALSNRERRIARHVVRDDVAIENAVSPHDEPDHRAQDVMDALASLEPLLREAFLLRHVEGLSYAEMMQCTGARESALKMRVKRACDALRTQLEA